MIPHPDVPQLPFSMRHLSTSLFKRPPWFLFSVFSQLSPSSPPLPVLLASLSCILEDRRSPVCFVFVFVFNQISSVYTSSFALTPLSARPGQKAASFSSACPQGSWRFLHPSNPERWHVTSVQWFTRETGRKHGWGRSPAPHFHNGERPV